MREKDREKDALSLTRVNMDCSYGFRGDEAFGPSTRRPTPSSSEREPPCGHFKCSWSSPTLFSVFHARRYAATRLLLVAATILCCTWTYAQAAKSGSWTCYANQQLISSGDFLNHRFAPILSPRARAYRWSTARHYLNNLTCTFTILAPSGHLIFYEFPAFDLHDNCTGDRVTIRGPGTRRVLCGDKRRLLHPYGTVSGNRLVMTFITDGSFTAAGFAGFFASFKPSGLASVNSGRKKRKRDLSSSGQQGARDQCTGLPSYEEPKLQIGESNLQHMRVVVSETNLEAYCRGVRRLSWELNAVSCTVPSDPWSMTSPDLTDPRLRTSSAFGLPSRQHPVADGQVADGDASNRRRRSVNGISSTKYAKQDPTG